MAPPELPLLMTDEINRLKGECTALLRELIAAPSFSRDEWQTASIISRFLADKKVATTRAGNNVLAVSKHFDDQKPTLLLASHHDTVKPNGSYTKDPFYAHTEADKLFGLGSTDAGGALVSLLAAFLFFYEKENLRYNVAFVAAAEEEVSGSGGIELALKYLPKIDCGLVGEPTGMQLAVAERGLVVLDCVATGKAGHAARGEGENAIWKAVQDIEWINTYPFEQVSELLGPVSMNVTVIGTENSAHNVIPDTCTFTVDVRINELYTPEQVVEKISGALQSTVTPRSVRLRPTSISMSHPLVQAGLALNRKPFGSPTLSDKALMPFPTLKIGPGNSARSHSADEFILLSEIEEGIDLYIQLLKQIL